MGTYKTCQELIASVREQVADKGENNWTDTDILRVADKACETIWTSLKLANRAHLRASEIVSRSSMVQGEEGADFTLPEHMGSLEMIEQQAGSGWAPMVHGDIADLSFGRRARRPFYVRTTDETIRIVNSRADSFRIWFLLRWAPLHFGTANAGSTTTLQFALLPSGVVKKRALYKHARLEIRSGANADAIVRITDFDPATATATFAALPVAIIPGTAYSMIVPVQGEHGDYVAVDTSMRLLQSGGNTDYLEALMILHAKLHERFTADIHQRDTDQSRFV